MSERRPFPTEQAVSEAYREVLLTNDTMARQAEVIDAFGLPSEKTQLLLEEFDIDHSEEEGSEYLKPLNMQYGRLFSAIGIELDINDTKDPVTRGQFMDADRVVPELLEPDQFTGYLGHIGCQAVYGDPLHLQLAKDVVEHLHNIVNACDRSIVAFQQYRSDNPDHAIQILKQYQASYLDRFRAVMPFYSNANFQQFIPAYVELEKRVLAKPDYSL